MLYIFFIVIICLFCLGFVIISNRLSKKDSKHTEYLILDEKLQNLTDSYDALKAENSEAKLYIEKIRNENIELVSENAKLHEKAERLAELTAELKESQKKYDSLNQEKLICEKQISELKTIIDKERVASKEKLELINSAQETLKKEFENISNKIFEDKRTKMLEENKTSMNTIINPLKDQLKDFKTKVENVYDRETRDRVSLQKEILSLKELNIQISKDALNLTNALKGDHKTQGTWGEIILEKVLDDSGLRNGHEYKTQFSTKDDEGNRKRPDVIVYLPDNKDVIIDSKVSLKNYEKYNSESNLDKKDLYLKQFILNIKNHIKELSEKKYEDLNEIRSLDYVLMFIPVEGAFMTAIESDRSLFSSAFQKNIVLVSPATLLVVLKTIQTIWRYEYQNRNSRDIADRAAKLYDKFCGFLESLQNVGKHINKVETEYQNALKQLSTGRGNLINQVESIKKLGLKTRKKITETIAIEEQSEKECTAENSKKDDNGKTSPSV